jgi:hypothetical protein
MERNGESVHGAGRSSWQMPYGLLCAQKGRTLYLHLFTPPMGDIILPELNGKIESLTLLSDGSDVPQVTNWGWELLKDSEIRIRPPKGLPPMSVLKIELKS